jgi:serine/threonine-protein kinase
MSVDDPVVAEEQKPESRPERGWLPWLALALILLVVGWLIWTNSDFTTAPDQKSVVKNVETLVRVPDVVGLTQAQAEDKLAAAGLISETELSFDSVAAAGTVAAQDPGPGKTVAPGVSVLISIATELGGGRDAGITDDSSDMFRVPDVVGLSQGSAEAALRSSGFGVEATRMYTREQPAGVVFLQTPAGGSSATGGETVSVLISRGSGPNDTAVVPDLMGMSRTAAMAAIEARGFVARATYQPYGSKYDHVYQQYPEAGVNAATGSTVFVLVSTRKR